MQSFDPASLKYMRSAGPARPRLVQLVDGNDVNYETGEMIYQTNDVYNFVDGRPYSWTLAGDGRYFGAMLTPAGLAEIKTYADGIGPWKPQVMLPHGRAVPGDERRRHAVRRQAGRREHHRAHQLIADAHAAGLFVHTYTFRNEQKYLAGVYKGDPKPRSTWQYFRAGIDGVFTDFANTGFAARKTYLTETGR